MELLGYVVVTWIPFLGPPVLPYLLLLSGLTNLAHATLSGNLQAHRDGSLTMREGLQTPYQALAAGASQPEWYGTHVFRKTFVEHRSILSVFR